MIYRAKDIYEKIKDGPKIHSEEELLGLLKADPSPISDEMLLSAFSELRLTFGQKFKLDNICFLFGNGCSIYAGSQSTREFNMSDALDKDALNTIVPVVEKIKDQPLEQQLDALLTVQEYYHIIGDVKEEDAVERIIDALKKHFLEKHVNSIRYDGLEFHEILLLKLRSFGCLNKTHFYTPNYDMVLEYVLDKMSIEYANGFSGFINRKFDPRSLQIAKTTKLVKFHGSVNWIFDERDKVIKEIQPKFKDGAVSVPDAQHVLVYPTLQKIYQTYNAPYSELMRNMLDDFESHSNLIIVLGYKYGDEHINEILYKAVVNPNNIFYFFDYARGDCDFIQRMVELSRNTQNINILTGEFLGDFATFVKYMLPANAEKTDEEKIFELLHKVMERDA